MKCLVCHTLEIELHLIEDRKLFKDLKQKIDMTIQAVRKSITLKMLGQDWRQGLQVSKLIRA